LFLHSVPGAVALEALQAVVSTLTRVGAISAALVLAVLAVLAMLWLRERLFRARPVRDATWGCGYGAPNSRMQYTGASFSTDFSAPFKSIMITLKRQKAPQGYFPSDSYVITDCVDAVERRLYSVIGHGDDSAADISRKMHEDDPRLAFAAGLAGIVAIAALVVLAEGALP
jgi:hydrogenase-4 component B